MHQERIGSSSCATQAKEVGKGNGSSIEDRGAATWPPRWLTFLLASSGDATDWAAARNRYVLNQLARLITDREIILFRLSREGGCKTGGKSGC